MRQGIGANHRGHDPSERRAAHCADEARLGTLLERAYTAREARITTVDNALAKLDIALDAIGTPPQRRADHHRLFGACAFAMLVVLLLSPVARAEFMASTRPATRSTVIPINAAGGGAILAPVAVAASAGVSVAPTERDMTATHAPVANRTAPMTGVSETPLRDLLARAGIHAADPPGGTSGEGQPPQH